ncbi:MAG TPA: threonine synthase, partial [Candidatus Limnocylindrales bacterium]|nr:threonine synthase [Candidatus Limnocylindrales bacterium]
LATIIGSRKEIAPATMQDFCRLRRNLNSRRKEESGKGQHAMRYRSTRGKSSYVTAAETIIKGLAPDGGLYVPADRLPQYGIENLPRSSYQELAVAILTPFLTDFNDAEIEECVHAAYKAPPFDHPAVTPLRQLSENTYILELWHGPTYAFKDIALQILPHLMQKAAQKTGENTDIVILTATSGDTGKSALEGFRDAVGTRIVVYYPENGVSKIQKLQMTTQEGNNVSVAAVKGNFDDAQTGVKKIFNDPKLALKLAAAGYRLSSANSINWGRLLPQIVYYYAAYRELLQSDAINPGEKINFVVPTGNFGNILAGYYAKRTGLPVNRLICAANRNNVLADFINSGLYNSKRPLHNTISPSMDILKSSNLERLLFEISGHDSERIARWMEQLNSTGEYRVDADVHHSMQELFWSDYADDDETAVAIANTYREYGYLIDPQTAVGKTVSDKYRAQTADKTKSIILSTASPFKFNRSVAQAIFGHDQSSVISEFSLLHLLAQKTGSIIPPNLANLEQKPEKHKQVIACHEMPDHLLNILAIK